MPARARVGIDAWPASTHAPGVGRYARELIHALADLARTQAGPSVHLFEVGPGMREFAPSAMGIEPLPTGWSHRRSGLPRRLLAPLGRVGLGADRLLGGVDLFQRVLPGSPPVRAAHRVLALSELGAPDSQHEADVRKDVACGDHLLLFSQRARELALQRFEVPEERVHVLPVGCDHWLRDASPLERPQGPARVLALGRVDASRAPLALADACALLLESGRDLELVFCGRPGDAAQSLRTRLAEPSLRGRARWIEAPRESELPALVAATSVLAHLGHEELTAVTPLEAMAFGAAVLAPRHAAFREALAQDACWIPDSAQAPTGADLAPLLEQALDSGADPAARRVRRDRAARFTWSTHASLTLELWARILES